MRADRIAWRVSDRDFRLLDVKAPSAAGRPRRCCKIDHLTDSPIRRNYDGDTPKASHPPSPAPKTFGDRLRAVRLDRGLTLNQLAIASGLGFKMVQSLESGQRLDPPASEVIALCKALNVSADELLGLK